MAISFFDLTVKSYLQVMDSSIAFLAKGREHAEAQGVPLTDFVSASLHPDMNPLHFQIVSIVHHSRGALLGVESGEFGPPTGYGEMDYLALEAFLATTRDALAALDPAMVESWVDNELVFKLGDMSLPFTARDFVLSFSLPNFYFHSTTAYDILRSRGVPLGKRDYLGQIRVNAR
ncbi:MAG: DUF1993 domain-containing protein [Pseudomonadota bacterium]